MGTDQDWQKWGETDPYFGVLTVDRFRSDAIGENRDEFFATGESDVDTILERYTRCFGQMARGSVLDFGCGVGRLTLAFARRFEHAVGLDIAPAMLAEARVNAGRLGIDKAEFAISDDALSAAPGQYDFVNSLIVLQHIPTARGLPIIARLLDKVKPGGGCMLHIAVERRTTGWQRLSYLIRHHIPLGNVLLNVAKGKSPRTLPMQMNEYPVPAVLALYAARGMSEVLVDMSDHGGVTTLSITAHRPE